MSYILLLRREAQRRGPTLFDFIVPSRTAMNIKRAIIYIYIIHSFIRRSYSPPGEINPCSKNAQAIRPWNIRAHPQSRDESLDSRSRVIARECRGKT